MENMNQDMIDSLSRIAFIDPAAIDGNYAYCTGQVKQGGDERLAAIAHKAMSFSWNLTLSLRRSLDRILGVAIMVMVPGIVAPNGAMVRRKEASI